VANDTATSAAPPTPSAASAAGAAATVPVAKEPALAECKAAGKMPCLPAANPAGFRKILKPTLKRPGSAQKSRDLASGRQKTVTVNVCLDNDDKYAESIAKIKDCCWDLLVDFFHQVKTRVADFYRYTIPKLEKVYQRNTKCTEWL
jgi:hypothetical protein